jgi:hypothetical protein
MLFKQPSNRARDDDDDNAPIWSPAIKRALDDWHAAKRDRDENALKDAARDMINATAAYHRAGGVPLFAHRPLPPQFVASELRDLPDLPQSHFVGLVDAFVDKFDDNAKSVVAHQVVATLKRQRTAKDEVADSLPGEAGRVLRPPSVDDRGMFEAQASRGAPALPGSPLEDRDQQKRGERSLQERADELDARDSLARVAHPIAYAGDQAANTFFGEDGLLGDWGKRPVVPPPSDPDSRKAADALQVYLEYGMPIGGAAKVVGTTARAARGALSPRITGAIQRVLDTRAGSAIASGTLSVMVEWVNSSDEDPATEWDYAVAFLGGAITGGVTPKWGKAEMDAGIAFTSSIFSDAGSGRRVSIEGALAAGFAAWVVTRVGGLPHLKNARLFSQMSGKYAKKFFEKEAKAFLKAMFGEQWDLAEKQWNSFWIALQDHVRNQWSEFVERDDHDPIF